MQPIKSQVATFTGRVKILDKENDPLQMTWQTKDFDSAYVPPKCGMPRSALEDTCLKEPWQVELLGVV